MSMSFTACVFMQKIKRVCVFGWLRDLEAAVHRSVPRKAQNKAAGSDR